MVIDAAFFQTGRRHDVCQRRAIIPLAVEDIRRPAQDHLARIVAFGQGCSPSDQSV
jgi:hypothetical protein